MGCEGFSFQLLNSRWAAIASFALESASLLHQTFFQGDRYEAEELAGWTIGQGIDGTSENRNTQGVLESQAISNPLYYQSNVGRCIIQHRLLRHYIGPLLTLPPHSTSLQGDAVPSPNRCAS